MNPNHFLAAAIAYLFAERKQWRADAAIGKTVVSSSIIDRVARKLNRKLVEVPVGFKWFVEGLGSGSFGFAGEESAGASFLKRDGTVWTTDKDGIILGLVAAEIIAKTGRDPSQLFKSLTDELGMPHYERIDMPATAPMKNALKSATPEKLNMQGAGRRRRHRDADHRTRQRPILWWHQGESQHRAGSRRGRPAPRTFARSMRKVSATPRT